MSATTITPIVTSRPGSNFTTASQTATGSTGDFWTGTGTEWLLVNNTNGGSVTVTLVHQGTIDGQALTNNTVAIPNNNTMLIGPFPTGLYNDASGNVNVTWSATANVKIAVYRLGT